MQLKETIRTFQKLAKSGIVTLVLISVLGGYLIGHSPEFPFDGLRLLQTLIGILLLSSGCSALNQLQEKKQDALMKRTAQRPLATDFLSVRKAMWFIFITTQLGLILLRWVGPTLQWMGLAAFIFYNGLYTLWWKKKWAFAAVPGAIPGALPIWMGYIAAGRSLLDPGGIYLFLILFFWQMPHFWTLALKYKEDYRLGGFPTLPVKYGSDLTLQQIGVWCFCYVALATLGPLFLKVGVIYCVIAFFTSVKVLIEFYAFWKDPFGKRWLSFFLWINFSLILYLFAAVIDLWSFHVPIAPFTR